MKMLRALRWAILAWAFLSLERKQVPDLDPKHTCKFLQSSHRRRVHAALNQTDEIHRAADHSRKSALRQFPRLAQGGDPLAKFLLKHGNEISHKGADGNGAKLRIGLGVMAAPGTWTSDKPGSEL